MGKTTYFNNTTHIKNLAPDIVYFVNIYVTIRILHLYFVFLLNLPILFPMCFQYFFDTKTPLVLWLNT